jgi:hypothetical protein
MKKSTANSKLWLILGVVAILVAIPVIIFGIWFAIVASNYPPKMATKEEKVDAMKNARFDKSIIAGIVKYDTLNSLVYENIDTLMGYRNSRNHVIVIGANSSKTEEIQKEDCHIFFPDYKDGYEDNLPGVLHNPFKTLIAKYFNNKKPQFYLCLNGRATYLQKIETLGNGLYLTHQLFYMNGDEKYKTEYSYTVKDTVLRENVIYNISLDEYHGH